ncbi:MAG: hypothetical protein K6L76_01820 [Agarilytica sp.]
MEENDNKDIDPIRAELQEKYSDQIEQGTIDKEELDMMVRITKEVRDSDLDLESELDKISADLTGVDIKVDETTSIDSPSPSPSPEEVTNGGQERM